MTYKSAMTTAFLAVVPALAGCEGEAPKEKPVEVVMSEDPVELASNSVSALHEAISKKYTRSSINKYRNVTEEVLKSGVVPKTLLKDGKLQNPWGGNIQIQVFPQNAWKADVPATINYVFGAVPKKQCSELVRLLGRQSKGPLFQLNVEPSKKVHSVFPISVDDGCSESTNNIGYTLYAK